MSTTARKARKRAGLPFTPKPAKTPTPLLERAFITEPVQRLTGDAMPAGMKRTTWAPRSPARVAAFLASGGRTRVAIQRGRD